MKYLLLLAFIACGPTPVSGNWEALDVRIENHSFDFNYEFTDRTIMSKSIVYNGASPEFTTIFSGTYTWQNESDGTHVITSFSSASITGPQGPISVDNNAVCVELDKGNCEGFRFTPSAATQATECVCKRQTLVFKVEGGNMSTTIGNTMVTFTRPPR